MATANNWSYKAGEKGRNRVRAYAKASSGTIYLEFYERDPETGERKRSRVCTHHRDRDKAKKQADQLAAEFGEATPERERETTLRELFDRYEERRSPQVSERRQRFHDRISELFCRYYGWERGAESLNRADWDEFTADRGSGAIDQRGNTVPEGKRTKRKPATVKRDLQGLRAVLNWGVQADLLKRNPTDRYPLPSEESPNRPRVTEERYQKMLKVASEVDWRFRLALVLANETGHRVRAIRRLRWSDIDLGEGLITWRAQEDKTGYEHVTPMTPEASHALREARAQRPAVGDTWIFPAPEDGSEPCSRHLFRDWWNRAEKLAKLEHVKGLGWHGLRRKFADEHRDSSLKEIADLGGWKTPRTISEVYQGADLNAMREAQNRRRTLRQGAVQGE